MNDKVAWILWFILGIILVITGIQGSFGRALACIFCPGIVVVNS